MRVGDWMQTKSGGKFWPLDPRAGEIELEDIAHALSMICRFGGHCLRFYSVAEHCVLLSRAAPRPYKKWALLHDASEAYLLDLPRPLKASLPDYKRAENVVARAIAFRFNLHLGIPGIVKDLDRRILLDERAQNMTPTSETWSTDDARPLGVVLQFWSPDRARREFLDEYERIAA